MLIAGIKTRAEIACEEEMVKKGSLERGRQFKTGKNIKPETKRHSKEQKSNMSGP